MRKVIVWTIAAILSGVPVMAAQNAQNAKAAREQVKQDREKLKADKQAGNKEAVKQDIQKLKADREALREAVKNRRAQQPSPQQNPPQTQKQNS